MKRFQILNEEKEIFELWGWKVSYVPTFFLTMLHIISSIKWENF